MPQIQYQMALKYSTNSQVFLRHTDNIIYVTYYLLRNADVIFKTMLEDWKMANYVLQAAAIHTRMINWSLKFIFSRFYYIAPCYKLNLFTDNRNQYSHMFLKTRYRLLSDFPGHFWTFLRPYLKDWRSWSKLVAILIQMILRIPVRWSLPIKIRRIFRNCHTVRMTKWVDGFEIEVLEEASMSLISYISTFSSL